MAARVVLSESEGPADDEPCNEAPGRDDEVARDARDDDHRQQQARKPAAVRVDEIKRRIDPWREANIPQDDTDAARKEGGGGRCGLRLGPPLED